MFPRAMGLVTEKLNEWHQEIPGIVSEISVFKEMLITRVCKTLRFKVLKSEK